MNDRPLYRCLILALLLGAISVVAQAQYTEIYTFNSSPDGCCTTPPGLLAQGTDGFVYGTQPTGAPGNQGSWFEYAMSGAPAINPFGPGSLMEAVRSGLTLGIDGKFYGSATNVSGATWHGALFSLLGGTITSVYSFDGTAGYYPHAPPVQGFDGNLYGIAEGSANSGWVYQAIPNANGVGTTGWHYALPSSSTAPLLLASDGNFYGTYSNGSFGPGFVPSSNGYGGIFAISQAGAFLWYYNLNPFSSNNGGYGDGEIPHGSLMQAADGNLYGTASGGGEYGTTAGVVYKIALNGTGYTPIHNFQSADGTAPMGGLVQGSDLNLYGLASKGGALPLVLALKGFVASGTLFSVDYSGANFKKLFNFYRDSGSDGHGTGSDPEATPLLHTTGKIYGLTDTGGFPTNRPPTGSGGLYDDGGEFFSYGAGLHPFISVVGQRSAHVGDRITIIGQGFLTATGITFGGVAGPWVKFNPTIWNDTSMTVTVPSGARNGVITVMEPVTAANPTGNLSTLYNFNILCSPPFCIPIHHF